MVRTEHVALWGVYAIISYTAILLVAGYFRSEKLVSRKTDFDWPEI